MTLHGTRETRPTASLIANLDDRIALLRNAMAAENLNLAVLVAGWIETERIAKGEQAAEIAARLLESDAHVKAARVLSETGCAPELLRLSAAGLATLAGMTDAQWAAENFWHGHEKRGF